MPWNQVMDKWKSGSLKSGGSGTPVKSQKQAVAIMLSEKRAAAGGKKEYAAVNGSKSSKSGACDSCMGRKVIKHSPPKHPEQGDPYAAMDAMTEKAAKNQPGTMQQMRKEMKPFQQESPKPAQGLSDYLKKLYGGSQ